MSGISSFLSAANRPLAMASVNTGHAHDSSIMSSPNASGQSLNFPKHQTYSNNRSNQWRGRGRGRGSSFQQRGSSFRGRGRGSFHSSSSREGSRYQKFNNDNHHDIYGGEEKDERASAEEEALALKLLENEELQTAGSELFIPIEQEYDMFFKKVLNWKNDSHSISQQVSDGEQLKQFRSYDEEATERCKHLIQQTCMGNLTTGNTTSIDTLTVSSDHLLTSAYRDVVKKIQEQVAQGQSKHYAKLDKTILHYEDILYSLMKVPKFTSIPQQPQHSSTLGNSSESTNTQFEQFKNIFERKQREKQELKNFSNFANNLFEKCTELFNIAEEAPVWEIENDSDVQQAIQQVIDSTRKTTVYQNTSGPYDYGTLLQALLDLMGRKSKHQTSQSSRDKIRHSERSKYQSISTGDEDEESRYKADSVLTKRKRENEDDDSDNEEENDESSDAEETSEENEHSSEATISLSELNKCKTTIELLGDRYRLLPHIHKWLSLLDLSMGATGIDFHSSLKTSFKKRQKQIRQDLSVAQRPDWKHKEAKQVAVLASSSTSLSKSIISSSNKCLDVVNSSLLYKE
ncbi:hypothetical protein C9374_012748 [Naegleria lovaniensis]|uniref:Uncharacterized protein n=1 Tax=Naegleria lovaniensis TaxID=51637 RepID=A0AA88KED3_NAELO|nr:uncharacterized protein C9374_012748 [Naegleria lovaniensis]KAG2373146.1 hypothetical protein C9374_012748 [Naegleria lovaniensis]